MAPCSRWNHSAHLLSALRYRARQPKRPRLLFSQVAGLLA